MNRIASIEKSDDKKHWVVKVSENGEVVKMSIVTGTHEEATALAEQFLAEDTSKPQLLRD